MNALFTDTKLSPRIKAESIDFKAVLSNLYKILFEKKQRQFIPVDVANENVFPLNENTPVNRISQASNPTFVKNRSPWQYRALEK